MEFTREEHEEFRRSMEAENKRLADEDSRQNRRIDLLEQNVERLVALTASVERLAANMENTLKELERQGKRLDALEVRDEVSAMRVSMERTDANVGNALEAQKQQAKRLDALEGRDGDMWRKVVSHIITTAVGAVVMYMLLKLGIGG